MLIQAVTLTVRTIFVTNPNVTSSTSKRANSVTAQDIIVDSEFVSKLLESAEKPLPNHTTLPAHIHRFPAHRLPAKILLFYYDSDHSHALAKTKSLKETFLFRDMTISVAADVALSTDSVLQDVVKAPAKFDSKVKKLRREELVTFIVLGDYNTATTAKEKAEETLLEQEIEIKTMRAWEQTLSRRFKRSQGRLLRAEALVKQLTHALAESQGRLRSSRPSIAVTRGSLSGVGK